MKCPEPQHLLGLRLMAKRGWMLTRQARKESSTGSGINHQNIFEEPEDYYQFIATLDRMRVHYDEDGWQKIFLNHLNRKDEAIYRQLT